MMNQLWRIPPRDSWAPGLDRCGEACKFSQPLGKLSPPLASGLSSAHRGAGLGRLVINNAVPG